MAENRGIPPPPSYAEAQKCPQFDSSGQPVSHLGPPLSQTGSIFTYNTPSTDHQQTYSTQPAGTPPPIGIAPREAGAPPPEYSDQRNLFEHQRNTYGAHFGINVGPPQAQFGSTAAGFSSIHQTYGPSPTAPVAPAYQTTSPYNFPGRPGTAAVYNPSLGTVQTVTMPAGYNTTPLAYHENINTADARQYRKKMLIVICVILFFIVLISTFAGMFM